MEMKNLINIVRQAVLDEICIQLNNCSLQDGIYEKIQKSISNENYEQFEEEIDYFVANEIDNIKQFLKNS